MHANAHESPDPLNALSESVIGAAYEVQNILGPGFLEKVYERALLRELITRGLRARSQVPLSVTYKGHSVGDYLADLIVEDQLIIEIKCVEHLTNEHLAQALNYLKASGRRLALLISFQKPKVEVKRVVNNF
jgi:GxxExxY protein